MQAFESGDNLVFQLESGYGILRVLAVDHNGDGSNVWHLTAYEELFLDVESAEAALTEPGSLGKRVSHMALTDRAFERTPAARVGNHPVTDEELEGYRNWLAGDRVVSDRSALLMLGLR